MTEPLQQQQRLEPDGRDDWPVLENVLLSLSESVRPTAAAYRDADDGEEGVAADVRSCLAEPVQPTAVALRLVWRRPWWLRQRGDDVTVAAAARLQTRLMGVRSAHVDGKYYGPETEHVSRTVEWLCHWTEADADGTATNRLTYTVGTVLYDDRTGACHLHGLADPGCRVTVDCSRLSAVLPRHRSTIKLYSEFRTDADAPLRPVLVAQHFHAFSLQALFR